MIDDLRPATEYEFAVKIVRGRRQSPWSLGKILHKMAIITITIQGVRTRNGLFQKARNDRKT